MNHDNIEPWFALALALALWLVYFSKRCHDEWNRLDDYYTHVARHRVFTEGCEHCISNDEVEHRQGDSDDDQLEHEAPEASGLFSGVVHDRSVADDLRATRAETHHFTMDKLHAERTGRRQ